jgi:hypothetical protein
LIFLKKIFKWNNITKSELYSFIPNRRPDLIKEIEERDLYDENNARAKAMLMQNFKIETDRYIKKTPTKKNLNNDHIITEIIQEVLDKEQKKIIHTLSKSNFLNQLTQDIIDKMGLVIFDVNLLKKTNRVLFTFIDKENKKWYYAEQFAAEIYISKKEGIINNDYIEEITSEYFDKYIVSDIQSYTRIKYMLNDSYRRVLNGSL